jgi:voltage-gated potassium channel
MTAHNLCREIYFGSTPMAVRVRYALLGFDVVIISYFVVTTFVVLQPWMAAVDASIGVLLAVDLTARIAASDDRLGMLIKPMTLIDMIVIASLFLPATFAHFTFMRVIRALRLMRSYSFTRELRQQYKFFRRNEEVIFSALNLIVFIFVVTAIVFVMQVGRNASIQNYIDALYFTITTLTTTGFGDITLVGSTGRMLSVAIMIIGVALFIRLVQAIFRPVKVRYECQVCGLTRHDLDAVHCKHCGAQLHIRHEGLSG